TSDVSEGGSSLDPRYGGNLPVTVTLSAPSDQTVTVNYAATGGTAAGNGVDYILFGNSLTFLPGETRKNIVLAIIPDTIPDGDPPKTVELTLSSSSNAILSDTHVHTLSIVDNFANLQNEAPWYAKDTFGPTGKP